MIYLDNAATTRVYPALRGTIDKYMYEEYGNPGSAHKYGEMAKEAICNSRKIIGEFINAAPDNITFTSSGSEANTLAILGLEKYLKKCKKTHIITSKYEHHSVLNAFHEMERRGFRVTYIEPHRGYIRADDVKNAIRHKTGFVSIMYVNNEIGTVNDISAIYNICKERGVIFHSDCVQAAGTYKIHAEEMADMISISGHKLHAPKGTGCLYATCMDLLSNIIFGGNQEAGIRPGTENVAGIVALGDAISRNNVSIERNHSDTLKGYFIQKLFQECAKNGVRVRVNEFPKKVSPKIISITFPDIDAHTLVLTLSNYDVCVSTSSACSSSEMKPSHVLTSCGFTADEALSTIRVSFSLFNTISEVIGAASIIAECVKLLTTEVF